MDDLIKHQKMVDADLTSIFEHYAQIKTKQDYLFNTRVINRTIAGECAALLPSSFAKRPINTYTITPSKTNLRFASEALEAGAWVLIAAAVTALSVGAWHLYKWIAKKNNWPIPGETSDNPNPKNTPTDAAAVDKSAAVAEQNATTAIERTDDLIGTFLDANTKLNEILTMHDGQMEIKEESMIGSDDIKRSLLAKMGGKGAKVNITMEYINVRMLPFMFPKTDACYRILYCYDESNKKNHMVGLFSIGTPGYSDVKTKLMALKTDADALAELDETLTKIVDIDSIDAKTAEEIAVKLGSINTKFKQSQLPTKLDAIKERVNPRIASANIRKLADIVALVNSDAYKDLYKTTQEILFIGEKAFFKLLGNIMVALSKLDENIHKRKDVAAKERSSGTNGSDAEKAEVQKDGVATVLMKIARELRTFLSAIQELMTSVNPIIHYMHNINHAVGTIFRRLIEQLTKIYTDNGKQVENLTKLSGELEEALRRKTIA